MLVGKVGQPRKCDHTRSLVDDQKAAAHPGDTSISGLLPTSCASSRRPTDLSQIPNKLVLHRRYRAHP